MQSPQNTGQEQPSYGQQPEYTPQPAYGQQQPAYGQQPGYGQQPVPYGGYASAPIPSATGGYEGARTSVGGKRTLKKIDVGSAFKVGAVTYALVWAILGLPYVFILGAVMSAAANATGQSGAIGAGGGIGMYIGGLIFSAIGGGIFAAVGAFAYNIVSGWVGGLEVEVA